MGWLTPARLRLSSTDCLVSHREEGGGRARAPGWDEAGEQARWMGHVACVELVDNVCCTTVPPVISARTLA